MQAVYQKIYGFKEALYQEKCIFKDFKNVVGAKRWPHIFFATTSFYAKYSSQIITICALLT